MKNIIPYGMIILFIMMCYYAGFVFHKDLKEARYMNLTIACTDCQSQPKDWFMLQENEIIEDDEFIFEED